MDLNPQIRSLIKSKQCLSTKYQRSTGEMERNLERRKLLSHKTWITIIGVSRHGQPGPYGSPTQHSWLGRQVGLPAPTTDVCEVQAHGQCQDRWVMLSEWAAATPVTDSVKRCVLRLQSWGGGIPQWISVTLHAVAKTKVLEIFKCVIPVVCSN